MGPEPLGLRYVVAMATFGLLTVARTAGAILDDKLYTEEVCQLVVAKFGAAGLRNYASLRLGFPPDKDMRVAFVVGWCAEVGISQYEDLAICMVLGALDLSLDSCMSPLVANPELFVKKRLLAGRWVEDFVASRKCPRSLGSPSTSASVSTSVSSSVGLVSTVPLGTKAAPTSKAASCLASVSASLVSSADSRACDQSSPPALASKYAKLREKDTFAISRLISFLGPRSVVYIELYGRDGKVVPTQDMLSVQNELLIGAKQPGCVASYVRECFCFFDWAAALSFDICDVGVVVLCSYFRACAERGRSIPNLSRCALAWCQSCTRTQLGVEGSEVKALSNRDA